MKYLLALFAILISSSCLASGLVKRRKEPLGKITSLRALFERDFDPPEYPSQTTDFCYDAHFGCPSNKVLSIQSAAYGRMALSVCIAGENDQEGYIGCSADATEIMDLRCGGLQYCRFRVHSIPLTPCGEMNVYLQVTYTCE